MKRIQLIFCVETNRKSDTDTGYGGLKKTVGNVTHLGMLAMITVYSVRVSAY